MRHLLQKYSTEHTYIKYIYRYQSIQNHSTFRKYIKRKYETKMNKMLQQGITRPSIFHWINSIWKYGNTTLNVCDGLLKHFTDFQIPQKIFYYFTTYVYKKYVKEMNLSFLKNK